MAFTSGLTEAYALVLGIAHLPDSRPAGDVNHSRFARRQDQVSVLSVSSAQPRRGSGGSDHLTALPGPHFDIVDFHTQRNIAQRHAVSDSGLTLPAAEDILSVLEAHRRQDVPLFSVFILHQGNIAAPVGIVFDSDHFGGHIVLVPLEVDHPILPLVPAATVSGGNLSAVVASALFLQRFEERLLGFGLRNLGELVDRAVSSSRRGRFVFFDRHDASCLDPESVRTDRCGSPHAGARSPFSICWSCP